MRFPSLFRRSSRLNDEAKETVQRKTTADVKRVEKDEKTMASGERSSSNVSVRVEADSVSTQGSPALVASMLVDKLPHEYERENAVLSHARSTTTHKSTKRDFMEKLLSLSQQHIDEIPEMRRAMLVRRAATPKSRSSCDPRNTMQVTPAVPTTQELKHMEALRAKGVVSSSNNFFSPFEGKTDEEIADTATVMFLCVGCGPSLGEGLLEIEDGYTPMDVPVQTKSSGGTVQWGPSTGATTLTTHRTPEEESLDRIFANLAESTVDDEIVLRPPVCGRTEDLVQNRFMLAQKEHCDQSWGGSTISSRVTNYIGKFDKTQ
jgi:hypothetical protein